MLEWLKTEITILSKNMHKNSEKNLVLNIHIVRLAGMR